jgi:hypothetical protein
MSFKLRSAAFVNHVPFLLCLALLNQFSAVPLCVGSRPLNGNYAIDVANVEAYR